MRRQEVNMSRDAAIGALVALIATVVGVILGALIALIPSHIIEQRDTHAQRSRMWQMLQFESQRILVLCDMYLGSLQPILAQYQQGQTSVESVSFVPLPSNAWRAAVADGDFLAHLPAGSNDVFRKLSDAYNAISVTDTVIQGFMLYSETRQNMTGFIDNVVAKYGDMQQRLSDVRQRFQGLRTDIDTFEAQSRTEASRYQGILDAMKLIGAIGTGLALVLLTASIAIILRSK